MKTSELKKIVEDNGFHISALGTTDRLYVHRNDEYPLGIISETSIGSMGISTTCPKAIAQAVLDYTYTPLKEREEEKNYWLIFPKNIIKRKGIYDGESVEILSTGSFKTTYTQKEIDAMPQSWQGFFVKVEVK